MATFSFLMRGEDYTQFVFDVEADTRDEAYDRCESIYPEASILSCNSQHELQEIEERRYRRLNDLYDNDFLYDDYD